jgi:hypothetical protein
MPTYPCSKCAKFYALRKPKRDGSGFLELKHGYCLARTVFAKNRPGDEVLPIGAKSADLPNGQHNVVLVRVDSLELGCNDAVPRK